MGEVINLRDTAKILGVSESTLRRWLNSGNPDLLVPHWRSGLRKDFKFDKDEVLKWKEGLKVLLPEEEE